MQFVSVLSRLKRFTVFAMNFLTYGTINAISSLIPVSKLRSSGSYSWNRPVKYHSLMSGLFYLTVKSVSSWTYTRLLRYLTAVHRAAINSCTELTSTRRTTKGLSFSHRISEYFAIETTMFQSSKARYVRVPREKSHTYHFSYCVTYNLVTTFFRIACKSRFFEL